MSVGKVFAYSAQVEREEAAKNEAATLEVRVTKILESELAEFDKNHKSLGAHNGSEIPRFQKHDVI